MPEFGTRIRQERVEFIKYCVVSLSGDAVTGVANDEDSHVKVRVWHAEYSARDGTTFTIAPYEGPLLGLKDWCLSHGFTFTMTYDVATICVSIVRNPKG